jgi:hypothetical protein
MFILGFSVTQCYDIDFILLTYNVYNMNIGTTVHSSLPQAEHSFISLCGLNYKNGDVSPVRFFKLHFPKIMAEYFKIISYFYFTVYRLYTMFLSEKNIMI